MQEINRRYNLSFKTFLSREAEGMEKLVEGVAVEIVVRDGIASSAATAGEIGAKIAKPGYTKIIVPL